MKVKAVITALILLCILILPSCGGNKYRIALITDASEVDGNTVSRYAWEGAAAYAEKHNISCAYYKPSGTDASVLADTVAKAVSGGAELIILPGKTFETVCGKVQSEYQNVSFILLDGQCRDETGTVINTASNTASVLFSEKDAGFAAGYALVCDGITAVGFIGESEDCCAGFLQGADRAAYERGLTVNCSVYFVKDYDGTESIKEKAVGMYEEGVNVILAEGDGTLKPVNDAAKEKNGRIVGSYTDKRYYSDKVITSAVKNYKYVTNQLVTEFFEGGFAQYGGKSTLFGKENGGTGLPVTVNNDSNGNAFDRFESFDAQAYREFSAKASSGIYGIADGSGIGAYGSDIKEMLGLKNTVFGFSSEETDERS